MNNEKKLRLNKTTDNDDSNEDTEESDTSSSSEEEKVFKLPKRKVGNLFWKENNNRLTVEQLRYEIEKDSKKVRVVKTKIVEMDVLDHERVML